MNRPLRSSTRLRRPLAVASVLALTSGLMLSVAPTVGAQTLGQNFGQGGYMVVSGTEEIPCTDDNLDRLGRATGGEMHALVKEGICVIVHRFTSDGTFTLDARRAAPMQVLVVGAGGGGGGGSGWEDSTKASGAEPESGAGAGGAGGTVSGGTVSLDETTGHFTYTPITTLGSSGIYGPLYSTPPSPAMNPGATDGGAPSMQLVPILKAIPVSSGTGGSAGTAGRSTAGSTVGGQGGRGGDSSFGEFVATGGGGGFGGTGAEGSEPGVQAGALPDASSGGQKGGSNAQFMGGDIGTTPTLKHAAPGGAGAGGVGTVPPDCKVTLLRCEPTTVADGGAGGVGFSTDAFTVATTAFGSGGGGGTLDPGSPPFANVAGGPCGGGTDLCVGGTGGAGGDGEDALGWDHCGGSGAPNTGGCGGTGEEATEATEASTGGGGGGGGTDGSVTPGDSNAGKGGRGDNGVVYVRYAAFAEPAEVLPYTGRNSRGLAALALTMIGLGGATTAFARRRRTIA